MKFNRKHYKDTSLRENMNGYISLFTILKDFINKLFFCDQV